jgi:hypothetical protein
MSIMVVTGDDYSRNFSHFDQNDLDTRIVDNKLTMILPPSSMPPDSSNVNIRFHVSIVYQSSPAFPQQNLITWNKITTDDTHETVNKFTVYVPLGKDLSKDYSDDEANPTDLTPSEFSLFFNKIDDKDSSEDLQFYQTSLTFVNYYPRAVTGIRLSLTGPNYWKTNDGHNKCRVNGTPVEVEFPENTDQLLHEQSIFFPIPDKILQTGNTVNRPIKNRLSIICGETSLQLVSPNIVLNDGLTSGILTITPTYDVYDVAIDVFYRAVTSFADLNAYNNDDRITVTPKATTRRGKDTNEDHFSFIYHVKLQKATDMSRPFQLSLKIQGLGVDYQTTKEPFPNVLVIIDPDFSKESPDSPSDTVKPVITKGLRSAGYRLPFDMGSGHVPTLQVDQGFLVTQDPDSGSTYKTGNFDRFISIIVPRRFMMLLANEVNIQLDLRFVGTDTPQTLTTFSWLSLPVYDVLFSSLAWGTYYQDKKPGVEIDFSRYIDGPVPDSLSLRSLGLSYRFIYNSNHVCAPRYYTCAARYIRDCIRYEQWKTEGQVSTKIDTPLELVSSLEVLIGVSGTYADIKTREHVRVQCNGIWSYKSQLFMRDYTAELVDVIATDSDLPFVKITSWASLIGKAKVNALVQTAVQLNDEYVGFFRQVQTIGSSLNIVLLVTLLSIFIGIPIFIAVVAVSVWCCVK